jgi:hypothetical protein
MLYRKLGHPGARLFPRGKVIGASSVKIGLMISVDQRHGTKIDGHSFLRLFYSAAQVGFYVTTITLLCKCVHFTQFRTIYFSSVG